MSNRGMIRILSTVLALPFLLGGLLLAAAGCGRGEAVTGRDDVPRPALIVTAEAVDGETVSRYPGQVEADRRVPLSFRVGGPLVDLPVSEGQRVNTGDLLARIDPRDYRVQVLSLEARLAAAEAGLVQSREEYSRVRGLFEHDNVSRSEYDRARATLDMATAETEAADQALAAARLALEDTELRAPYAGTVAVKLVDNHQTVSPGQPVLQFQGSGGLDILIHVPEREAAALSAGASPACTVSFEALPGESYPARIKEFGTDPDAQTQTFPVTLALEEPAAVSLLPGMTATVSWAMNGVHRDAGVIVPLSALLTDEQGAARVWLVDPEAMTISSRPVTTGELTDRGMAIVDGLEPGDLLLAAGVHFVSEGQAVRPLDAVFEG